MIEVTPVPSMRDYIHQAPAALREAIRHLHHDTARIAAAIPFEVRRIDIVGSGTSLHAGIAVREAFEHALGVEARLATPNEYCDGPLDRVGAGTLVIGVSQTGRSTGTNRAMRLARRRGALAILVTGSPAAVGAQNADAVLDIRCGDEHVGARTKGYVATLFALEHLRLALSGRTEDASTGLPDTLESVIARADEALPAIADTFQDASAIWLVSYANGMATAREAALKLIETVRIPVLAYDVEEYMHGPYHCLEADTRLVFIAPPGPGFERIKALARFVAPISGHTLAIAGEPELRALPAGHRFEHPADLPASYLPIVQIPILQLLANELTIRRGREPGHSRYPEFHTVLASKEPPPDAPAISTKGKR
ncbi:MAG: SIS domain-containing protein [Propionicimonas sp.]